MFERYTEHARRALFFARYELGALGGDTIEPEHLLLGLIRESKTLAGIFNEWNVPLGDLRQQLEARVRGGDKFATSVEVPFSESARRVLQLTAEEADRLQHPDIEPQHLLVALMREPDSFAATSLTRYGLTLEALREYVATHPPTERPPAAQKAAAASHALASVHIQRIMGLVRDLEQAVPNSAGSRDLVERIYDELMILEEMWQS